jgi:hypothetical protein
VIAQVLIPAFITLPVAATLLVGLIWYWRRLGAEDVLRSRRRVRRLSLVVFGTVGALGVQGLSFVDPHTHAREFILVWTLSLAGAVAMILVAGLDALASLHGHRRHAAHNRQAAIRELGGALGDRRDGANGSAEDRTS